MTDATVIDRIFGALAGHVFADTTTCVCGHAPETGGDWERHRVEVAVGAVADWFAERSSPPLSGDPFVLAADWSASSLRAELRP